MRILSVSTSVGMAIVADLSFPPISPIAAPKDWGLIIWGRVSRSQALNFALLSQADWIADYSPADRAGIVVFSKSPSVTLGEKIFFDTEQLLLNCPRCGSSRYVSNGRNWICKDCNRQWKKNKVPN